MEATSHRVEVAGKPGGKAEASARRRGEPPGRPAGPGKAFQARDPARELEDLDAVMKALAHPARRHILLVLHFRGGIMSSQDIAARFACTWPTTTRHLGVLREAGLVEVLREGRRRHYELRMERMQIVREWLDWFEQAPLVDPETGVDPGEI